MTLTKLNWRKDEVISFLEEKILFEEADEDEIDLYEDYKWNGKINKNTYTFRNLVKEMSKEYRGE